MGYRYKLLRDTIVPAMEVMDFKTGTPLGKELDAIFQKVIDYRDSFYEPNFIKKSSMVYDFFGKNGFQQMLDAIEKHTGYTIVEAEAPEDGGMYSFCTAYMVGTVGAKDIMSAISAGGEYTKKQIDKKTKFKDLVKIAESFDPNTGTIYPKAREAMKDLVQVYLCFDFRLAFMMKDMLPPSEHARYLTAREITAIMLHEVGHTMTTIEHAADQYARLSMLDRTAMDFSKDANIELQMEVMKYASEKVATGEIKLPLESKKAMDNCLKTYESLSEEEKRGMDPATLTALAYVIVPLVFIVLGRLSTRASSAVSVKGNQIDKYGDLPTTLNDFRKSEILSDQYATRNGYGKELVSSLDALQRACILLGYSEAAIVASGNASLLRKLGYYIHTFLDLTTSIAWGDIGRTTYPDDVERWELVARECIVALKNTKNDPKLVEYYAKQYAEIKKIIDNAPRLTKWRLKVDNFWRLFNYYATFPGLKDMFVNGHITGELHRLFMQIDKLQANPLYYLSNVLNKQIK